MMAPVRVLDTGVAVAADSHDDIQLVVVAAGLSPVDNHALGGAAVP